MISSNILHQQFLSICSSHRKHCKEGAAATALCPLPYSDAVMKLGTDSKQQQQPTSELHCLWTGHYSQHPHTVLHLLLTDYTRNHTRLRNLPKIVHGKTPKKRKTGLTHCSSLPGWCHRQSSPLYLPSRVLTAEVEKVEEGRREAASPRLSGLSGRDAGTEGRIPTSNPYRMKCHSFPPLLPVMRAPAPTREKEGDRTSSLTSSPPSSASGSSVQEPGVTLTLPQAPVPPVLPIRPLNLLEPQALLRSH